MQFRIFFTPNYEVSLSTERSNQERIPREEDLQTAQGERVVSAVENEVFLSREKERKREKQRIN